MSVLAVIFLEHADHQAKYAVKICGIGTRWHIRIKQTCGNEEGGEVAEVYTGTSFFHFQPLLCL